MNEPRAMCACNVVKRETIHNGDGTCSEVWKCATPGRMEEPAGCGTEFVRKSMARDRTHYVIEMDNEGGRYWLCRHPNGEPEPLPADFSLQFRSDVYEVDGKPASLPLGTVVILEQPNPGEAKAIEEKTIKRILRAAIQKDYRRKAIADSRGDELTDEEADEIVRNTAEELLEGSRNPSIRRAAAGVDVPEPPQIIPGSSPLVQQLLRGKMGIKR